MKQFDLLTIGDVSIDQFMEISNAILFDQDGTTFLGIKYDSKVPVEKYQANIAGNSCNVAIACSKLGLKCAVYTILGDDPNGNKFKETFKKVGIDYSLCKTDSSAPTNVHTIINFQKNRTILSHHSERNYQLIELKKWIKKNNTPKWIYYTSMPPNFEHFQNDLVEYLRSNRKAGIAFNPGSFHIKAGRESIINFLEVTDILFVNLEEARFILNANKNTSIEELHANLRKLGPQVTVITDGKNGASAFDGTSIQKIDSYELNEPVVDRTGTGDAFASAFLSALNYNKPLKEALRWGSINAAHMMRKIGSVHGLLDFDTIATI